MTALLVVLLLGPTGCTRRIPPHLLVQEESPQEVAARTVASLDEAVRLLVERDPLVRAPIIPDRGSLGGFPEGSAILAYLDAIDRVERGDAAASLELQQLEESHAGTVAVPLARGYRLRMIENRLAGWTQPDEGLESEIAELLLPLPAADDPTSLPRRPLDWLAEGDRDLLRARAAGDAWALRGWFAAPTLPLTPVAESLAAPRYSAIASSDVGNLIRSRGAGARADASAARDALTQATWLALNRAAADRDHEQAAWAALKEEAVTRHGGPDPVLALLERARSGFTADAASDTSTAGALIALAARDWSLGCSPRCDRVDRTTALATAERFWPGTTATARTWQVIALKDALDTLEVGHETVLFPRAMLGLVDALIGTGAGPLDQSLLRRRNPDAGVWLALGRAVGVEGVTDWEGARVAIGQHLVRVVDDALTTEVPDAHRPLLERIRSRGVP